MQRRCSSATTAATAAVAAAVAAVVYATLLERQCTWSICASSLFLRLSISSVSSFCRLYFCLSISFSLSACRRVNDRGGAGVGGVNHTVSVLISFDTSDRIFRDGGGTPSHPPPPPEREDKGVQFEEYTFYPRALGRYPDTHRSSLVEYRESKHEACPEHT